MSNTQQPTDERQNEDKYDYSNLGRPRDFDIRVEVAEQKEIVRQSRELFSGHRWHCSEYDF